MVLTTEIACERQPTRDGEDGGQGKILTLRITHQPAGIDIDSGRRLPARFEAELAPQTTTTVEIPFDGQRICWAPAPRFSQQAMEEFTKLAMSRVAHMRWLPLSGAGIAAPRVK